MLGGRTDVLAVAGSLVIAFSALRGIETYCGFTLHHVANPANQSVVASGCPLPSYAGAGIHHAMPGRLNNSLMTAPNVKIC